MSYASQNIIDSIENAIKMLDEMEDIDVSDIVQELEDAIKYTEEFTEDKDALESDIESLEAAIDELREENENLSHGDDHWQNSADLSYINFRETISRLFDSGYTALEIEQALSHLPIKTL